MKSLITLWKSWLQVWTKWKVKRAKIWNLLEAVALHFSHDLAPSCFPALYMAHAAAPTYDCSLQESLFSKRSKRHKMYIFYMCFCRPFSVLKLCLPYVFESPTVHLLRNARLPLLLPKLLLIFCHLFNTRILDKRKRRKGGRMVTKRG